jgi:hypothetical protein
MRQGKPMIQSLRILIVGLLSLLGAGAAYGQRNTIDFQVIHLDRLPTCSDGSYAVLRSEQDWIACWKKGHAEGRDASNQSPPPKPPVDFERYTLLVASTGVKPSSGYAMIFTSVMEGTSGSISAPYLSVSVLALSPGSCPVLTALMNSTSYALIPKTAKRIVFTTLKADRDCQSDRIANEER